MEIKRDPVVQTQILIVNRFVMNHAKAESHGPTQLTPDKESCSLRHFAPQVTEIFLGEALKLEPGTFMDLEIKRINLINLRSDIIHNFQADRRGFLGFAELSSQTLSGGLT